MTGSQDICCGDVKRTAMNGTNKKVIPSCLAFGQHKGKKIYQQHKN